MQTAGNTFLGGQKEKQNKNRVGEWGEVSNKSQSLCQHQKLTKRENYWEICLKGHLWSGLRC